MSMIHTYTYFYILSKKRRPEHSVQAPLLPPAEARVSGPRVSPRLPPHVPPHDDSGGLFFRRGS